MTAHCLPITPIIIGSTETIRDLLCGPQQHAEHMKGWRFHLYVRDSNREAQLRALMAEVRKPLGLIR